MDERIKRKNLICELMEDALYVPMKEKELAIFLQTAKEVREELKQILDELLAEGRIVMTKRGRYQKPESEMVTGIFIGHQIGRAHV